MCADASDPCCFITDLHNDSNELCIGRIHQGQDIVPRLKGVRGVALIRPPRRGDERCKENQMAICIGRAERTHGTRAVTITVLCCLGIALYAGGAFAQPAGLEKIQHVIVIYQENWSFDGLYGTFPGADGIANAGERIRQMKKDGTPYTTLPQPLDTSKNPPIPDLRFRADLPVAPYDAARYVPADQKTGDIVNRALQQERQINGGRMDGFVAWSENGGLAMSYYDATNLPVGRLAQQYTLADRFFHSAFDGSLFNHFWLVCACTPVWPNAPANLVIQLDAQGVVVKNGSVTPDGYVVHTVYSTNRPYPASIKDPAQLMPLLTMPTIGDRLSEKGISWTWYSGGWKDSVIIITYDEAGGRWDHVPPPRGDRWGPGVRVPAIIISPYAKRRFVDHTTYETTSILKFIETRWQLAPLGSRDAAANNLFNAFDFSQTP